MNFLYKLERKWGRYAIPNLMRYILFGQAIVFLMTYVLNSNGMYRLLVFDRARILSGEIWRLFTFVFIPDSSSPFWFILFLLVYSSIANALEDYWGSFNFNVYYLTSMIACVVISFIFNITGFPIAYYINLSLFLSFATLQPDTTFMIYFIIPLKAKYLLLFYFVILGSDLLSIVSSGAYQLAALMLASFIGYFIFFAIPTLKKKKVRGKAKGSQKAFKDFKREQNYEARSPIKVAFHKCTICGMTELDDPEMEFRYCSKCNGHHEYCMNHLKNHDHIQ
ncbi:MAG: hypothetical protein ACRDDX_11770 [Cellulosilyticaceae bacterium]